MSNCTEPPLANLWDNVKQRHFKLNRTTTFGTESAQPEPKGQLVVTEIIKRMMLIVTEIFIRMMLIVIDDFEVSHDITICYTLSIRVMLIVILRI